MKNLLMVHRAVRLVMDRMFLSKRARYSPFPYSSETLEPRRLLAAITVPGSATVLETELSSISLNIDLPSSPIVTEADINWGDGSSIETHTSGDINADLAAGNYTHNYSSYSGHPSQSHADIVVEFTYDDSSTSEVSGTFNVEPSAPTIASSVVQLFDRKMFFTWTNNSSLPVGTGAGKIETLQVLGSTNFSTYTLVGSISATAAAATNIPVSWDPGLTPYNSFKIRLVSHEGVTSDSSPDKQETHALSTFSVTASIGVVGGTPHIALSWPRLVHAGTVTYEIFRRAAGATSWTSDNIPYDTVVQSGTTDPSWTDVDTSDGDTYEYCVRRFYTSTTGTQFEDSAGYVVAGIGADGGQTIGGTRQIPSYENRGTIVVLVDHTQAGALSAKIERPREDLVGDGWNVVLREDAPRAFDIANDGVHNNAGDSADINIAWGMIHDAYVTYSSTDEPVKQVLLIGHIPVPYSGLDNHDGHEDHKGAWTADIYYGDMTDADANGIPDGWTDSINYTSISNRSSVDESHVSDNHPDDGRYDNETVPDDSDSQPVELAVGRVDMVGEMSEDETTLLAQYFDKDHAYRIGEWNANLTTVSARGAIYPVGSSNSWQSQIETLLGAGTVQQASWFATLQTNARLLLGFLLFGTMEWAPTAP